MRVTLSAAHQDEDVALLVRSLQALPLPATLTANSR